MSEYLSRDALLAIDDTKTDDVEVLEWGTTVRIRALNAAEVESIGYSLATPAGTMNVQSMKGVSVKVVAWGVIDENGKQLFTLVDIETLGQKSFHAINHIAGAIMELTGLAEEEEEIKNG